MAGQSILIIIIPNDLNNEQEKSLNVAQVEILKKVSFPKRLSCSDYLDY